MPFDQLQLKVIFVSEKFSSLAPNFHFAAIFEARVAEAEQKICFPAICCARIKNIRGPFELFRLFARCDENWDKLKNGSKARA